MITLFTCTQDKCANKNIAYRVEDAPMVVVCGGCGITLNGVGSND
jgi:hypothetical protein